MKRLIFRRPESPACIVSTRNFSAALLTLALVGSSVGCVQGETAKDDAVAQSASGKTHVITAIATGAPSERTILPAEWEAVWGRGGSNDEELLAVVAALLPHEKGVVVADAGTLELHAFDAATGRTQWQMGRKGSGPGEFRDIGDITRDSAGNTLALDREVGRITTISPTGELLPYRASPSLQFAHAICALNDGSLVGVLSRADAWLALVRDSAVVRTYSFPAALPKGAPDFVKSANFARGESANTCPLFTLFGYGVGSVHTARTGLQLQPYIETLIKPEFDVVEENNGPTPATRVTLRRGTTASSRGSVWRDTVVLNFSRGEARPESLLDLFDTSGRYLGTWKFPASGIDFCVYANGMLYTLSNATVAPQITAWRRVTNDTDIHTN